MLHQLGGTVRGHPRYLAEGFAFVTDAINPAQSGRFLQSTRFNLVAQVRHHEDDVLDYALVHVGNVKGAVGSRATVQGTKAFVGRGDQFLLAKMIADRDVNAVGTQLIEPDKVAARLGYNRRTIVLLWELVASINGDAGRERERT